MILLALSLVAVSAGAAQQPNAPNVVQGDVGPLPAEFVLEFESFWPEPIEPREFHTLGLNYWSTFRIERRRRSDPTHVHVHVEKYASRTLRDLIHGYVWRSIQLNDVISIEGKRYQLAEVAEANCKLTFHALAQAERPGNNAPPVICIPRHGELVIGNVVIVVEQEYDLEPEVVVTPIARSHLQLARTSPKNRLTLGIHQVYARSAPSAKRFAATEGSIISIENQQYVILRVVEQDRERGLVGWLEISKK